MNNFFNHPVYFALEAKRQNGMPVTISTDSGKSVQLICRAIRGTQYSDLTSVYGYPDFQVGADELHALVSEMKSPELSDRYVSAYFRLGLGDALDTDVNCDTITRVPVGEIVAVNLQDDIEAIRGRYRKNLRYDLRQQIDFDVVCSHDFQGFHKIYSQNMQRLAAKSEYFFTEQYLNDLGKIDGVRLYLAQKDEAILGGAIIVQQNESLFYHLGATADHAIGISPMKHILDHVISTFNDGIFKKLYLGGGYGGHNSSLMRFKRGFSKVLEPVFALRVVLDQAVYDELSKTKVMGDIATGYFPAYRET